MTPVCLHELCRGAHLERKVKPLYTSKNLKLTKSCVFMRNPSIGPTNARRAAIADCRRCPRLVAWIAEQRRLNSSHHNGPVPDWGDSRARVLLVGLAPGRLGANRTGRAFVGDSSSNFLFTGLHAAGFASSAEPERAKLRGLAITNVVKCLPPQNAPTSDELRNCQTHLQAELTAFWVPRARKPRVLLSLGGVAHRALWKALPAALTNGRPCPPFSHGGEFELTPNLHLVSCFHTSKLNTQTGRLTPAMLAIVLRRVSTLVGLASRYE